MHTHPRRTRSFCRGLAPSIALLACNALTGVNDLDFDEEVLQVAPHLTGDAGSQSMPDPPGDPTPCDSISGDGCPPRLLSPPRPQPEYSVCTTDANCIVPYLCSSGVCRQPCQTLADCSWTGARCVKTPDDPRRFCSRNCDLVTTTEPRDGLQACGDGVRCSFLAATGEERSDCFQAKAGAFPGMICRVDADCAPNYNCFDRRCTQACDRRTPCAGDEVCGGLAPKAGQELGSCCSVPGGQACSLVTDCGCGPGETCTIADLTTGRTECRALPPMPVAPYAPTDSTAACPARHSLVDGVCKLHCGSVADCGGEGVSCHDVLNAPNNPVPGFSFCTRGCDPLSPAGPATSFRPCGEGGNCIQYTQEVADCVPAGAGVQGSNCSDSRGCAAGFRCRAGVCQRWCEPAAASCDAGYVCSSVFQYGARILGSCCQPPTGQNCDWASDCGCGEGETCGITANGYACRAVSQTPVPPLGACTSDSQCSTLHECAGGSCARRCSSASDCQQGAACIVYSDGDGRGFCSQNCDARAPQSPAAGFQACPSTSACIVTSVAGTGVSYCYSAGAAALGGDCTDTFDCSAGLDCYQGSCRRFCELSASDCPNGTACRASNPPVLTVGGRNLGLCLAN